MADETADVVDDDGTSIESPNVARMRDTIRRLRADRDGLRVELERRTDDYEVVQRSAAERETEATSLRRELTFLRAGVDDSPTGEVFQRIYEGPHDDPAAVKSAWERFVAQAMVDAKRYATTSRNGEVNAPQ